MHFITLGSMLLAVPLLLASQTPGEQRIATAREMLKEAKLDSATVLLRQVTDSPTVSSTNEQVRAWVLLGIVAYYRGTDSVATADAFRHVFALAPEAEAKLPDPALQQMFEGLRPLRGASATSAIAQPHSDIAGVYRTDECAAAPFPVQLPPLDSVLDSASLATALKSAGVNKPLVFGLRLGALAKAPRVQVIEKKVSGQVADRALQDVDSALRVVPADREWAFRLRVGIEPEFALKLERSEVCAAAPGPRSLQMRTLRVPAESLAQMRREAEQATIRRRSLMYRVLVDEKGHVVAVELVHSSGDPSTDEREADALRRFSFTPTKLDGAAVSAWVEVRGDR